MPGQAEVIGRGELALDEALAMTAAPLDRARSSQGEGKFWDTIADETQDSSRVLETVLAQLKPLVDQTKITTECYMATPLQLSAARRELISSATQAAFGCTEGAHVVHEAYAAADALRIHPNEVEDRPAIIVAPNGATYLLGEYAAFFTLLDIIPPPFDVQQTLKHGTPHTIVFLQDDPLNGSLDEILEGVPIRREHVDIVARGAAMLASYSLFQEPVTILPLALNVVLHGSYSHTLIRRFSILPRRADVILTTVHDNQRSATIELREGSRPRASDNLPLARLVLDDLLPSPAGTLRIEVAVVIDKYLSIIELEAVESKSGAHAKQVVERGVILYEDGVLEAQQAAEEDHLLWIKVDDIE
ncbi:hypothetical protein FRC06_008678 [Ceratobasidium sp. 370]|nr:hypothetical protein FRC06_008678 [Ceratobasidium sp. 370]